MSAASVPTDIPEARDAVRREREAVQARVRAYEAFEAQLEDLADRGAAVGDGGSVGAGASTVDARVRGRAVATADAIREAFHETVRPESVADGDGEPLEQTLAAELGPSLAATLSRGDGAAGPPDVTGAAAEAARTRRLETLAHDEALAKEAGFLLEAEQLLAPIRDWLRRADGTPLTALDFAALRERHDALGAHLDRCRPLLRARHAFVADATETEHARVPHAALAEYVYGDLDVSYPVLATTARIADVCREARRRVRRHMTTVV